MKSILLTTILAALMLGLTSMNIEKRAFKAPKDYTYIPSGNLTVDGNTVSVMGFFMSKYEISNKEYNEFLSDLKEENRLDDYEKAKRQNENWNIEGAHMKPFVEHYHGHQAYENYPVVTITKDGANLFCQWKAQQIEKKSKNKWIVKVRLPVEEEWMRAAQGGRPDVQYGWGKNELKNKKGSFYANFKHQDDGNFFITSPVNSYLSNDFGLYNMSGNVAELTKTDSIVKGGSWNDELDGVNIFNRNEYSKEASPFVGFRPVITVLKKN